MRRDWDHRLASSIPAKPMLPRTQEVGSGTSVPLTWIWYD